MMTGFVCLIVGILLLERLFRIADLVSQSPGKFSEASIMLISLVPHYLGIALPASFFLAVLLTVNRISRTGELVMIWAAGESLVSITKPFIVMGAALMAISLIISGFLQPLSRYEYRKTGHSITQTSIETVFQQGKFVITDKWVIWADAVDRSDGSIGDSFILERWDSGRERVIVSNSGQLVRRGNEVVKIELADGTGVIVRPNDPSTDTLDFDSLLWTVPDGFTDYRKRGDDERELTLPEIVSKLDANDSAPIPGRDARATFHDQFAWGIIMLILPFLAVPLGLDFRRTPTSNSVLVGILLIIIIQKSLEFGKTINGTFTYGPLLGSWAVVVILTIISAILYWRSAFTLAAPPLSGFPKIRLGLITPKSRMRGAASK